MNKKYKNIVRYYNVINRALFYNISKLGYSRTLVAIEKLSKEICKVDTDEDVWYIGENESVTLNSVIAGAYWFLTDYHGGQSSVEYRVYSKISSIFDPRCSTLEGEISEGDVYKALETLYNEYKYSKLTEYFYADE